jgi:hypothetical protein
MARYRRSRRVAPLIFIALLIASFAITARAEVIQRGGVRVSFDGALTPKSLPRRGETPIRVSLAAEIAGAAGAPPPQLRRLQIAINRNGHLDPGSLPVCQFRQIQPTTTADALATCGPSLVGEGKFTANVRLAGQSPFPASGRVLAFNGSYMGSPAILAHIYGTRPAPTSYTLVFVIGHHGGTFGTLLTASLPEATGSSGYVTGLSLSLGGAVAGNSVASSYLTAGCPAPKGFPGAVFPFAKATFGFAKTALVSTVTRSCKASG